jgi:hypothetical protein
MRPAEPGSDDTIRINPKPPPRKKRGRITLLVTAILVVAILAGAAGAWLLWPHPTPPPPPQALVAPAPPTAPAPLALPAPPPPAAPAFAIQPATEQQIREHVPTDLTIFRLAANPHILVLDFASLRQQGLMLNRVAALVEKAGLPRDRVLTDAELDQAIRAQGDTIETFYYGHDYSAGALARFFALADRDHIALNPEEARLRALLQQEDWLAPGTNGGLISIPAVGANDRVTAAARTTILRHELSHGEFFSQSDYAAFVHNFWLTALTEAERDGVRRFLAGEEYDAGVEELMFNEMQAYLMFTRDPRFFTARMVGLTPARLADLQARFLAGMPPGWLRDTLASYRDVSATPQ